MKKSYRGLHNRPEFKAVRQLLRHRATPAEVRLWEYLKQRRLGGRKFRRQHSIGPYIVDFYCPAEKLAIELDGAVHDSPTAQEYDQQRDTLLRKEGIHILRFANDDIFDHPDQVLACISACFT